MVEAIKETHWRVWTYTVVISKSLDVDMLIAAWGAPVQPWCNPAERVMSILNMGLQPCALERPRADPPQLEEKLASIGIMQELPASTDPEVRNTWSRCVTQLQEIVTQHFSCLRLTDKPIKSVESITPVELEEINNTIRSLFPNIDLTNLMKQGRNNVRSYHRWVEKHCSMWVYFFQMKKCCDVNCCCNN